MLIRSGDKLKITEPDGHCRIFKFAGVIVGVEEGETVSLSDQDIEILKRNIVIAFDWDKFHVYPVLTGIEC